MRLIIYIDNIIILNQNQQDLIKDRDTVIFILQCLGFVINWEKSHLEPTQKLEYLGMLIASVTMTPVPSREEVGYHHSEMSVLAFKNSGDDQRGFRTDRHVISQCTSSVVSSLALQEVTDDPDRGLFRVPFIQFSNNFTSTMQGGAELVDSQCETMQWEVSNKHHSRSDSNIRCVQSSMGCIMWQSQHWGIYEQRGERNSHQYLRANSSRVCALNILQGQTRSSCPSIFRQHQCIVLHCEDGGNQESGPFPSSQKPLGILSRKQYNPDSGLPARGLKQSFRLGIMQSEELQRMEAETGNIPLNSENFVSHAGRSVCVPDQLPAEQVHQLEARSICLENRCFQNPMGRDPGVCFSPFCSNSQSYGQSNKGESFNCISNTTVADTALVPISTPVVHSQSISHPSVFRFVTQPSGETPSFSHSKQIVSSGMESFRSNLISKGISINAASLIEKSRRERTRANYNMAWAKWAGWCHKQQVNPFNAALSQIIEFLTYMFQQDYQYRTINNRRSAISAYHPKIDNFPVGQHLLVCKLLAGIFNERPPQPKVCQKIVYV